MPPRSEPSSQNLNRAPDVLRRRPRTPTSPPGAAGGTSYLTHRLIHHGNIALVPLDSPGCLQNSSPARTSRGGRGKKRRNQSRPVMPASSSVHPSVSRPSQCIVDYSIPSRPRIRTGERLSVQQNGSGASIVPRPASQTSHRSGHSSRSAAPRSRSRLSARDGEAVARPPSRIGATTPTEPPNDAADLPPPYMPPSPPRAPRPIITLNSIPRTRDGTASTSESSDTRPGSPRSSSDQSLTDPEDATTLMFQLAWEHDREAGYSLEERVTRDFERREAAENGTTPRSSEDGLAALASKTDSVAATLVDELPRSELHDTRLPAPRPEPSPQIDMTLHDDTRPAIILRSTTPQSPKASHTISAISTPHLSRPLPVPPPSATPCSTSAYVSIFHTPPPTFQPIIPTTSNLASPDTGTLNTLPAPISASSSSATTDAPGSNRTQSSLSLAKQSRGSSNAALSFTMSNTPAIVGPSATQLDQTSPSPSTSGFLHPRGPPSPPPPRRSRLRSGSMPVAPPSSFRLSPPSSLGSRPRSPVLDVSLSPSPTIMGRVGTFEALTTRRRPPPPPRPTTPSFTVGGQGGSGRVGGGSPNSGGRGAAASLTSSSWGGSEPISETAVAVGDGDPHSAIVAPPQLPDPLLCARSEAAVFTAGLPFSVVASQASSGATMSEPDLGRLEHSIGASPAIQEITEDREAHNGHLHPSTDAVDEEQGQQPYEYTDLDLLVARLDSPTEGGQNTSYEDLLRITDFIGTAVPSSSGEYIQAVEDLPVAPVQVERRRITRDGRKKLKLSLMGVVIDRCSVCMSQFKQRELGVLLPCQHSFHPKCARPWLMDHLTCPLCRISVIAPT